MAWEAVLKAGANLLRRDGVEVGMFEDTVYNRDIQLDERGGEVNWTF
jgi:hypothetical protein